MSDLGEPRTLLSRLVLALVLDWRVFVRLVLLSLWKRYLLYLALVVIVVLLPQLLLGNHEDASGQSATDDATTFFISLMLLFPLHSAFVVFSVRSTLKKGGVDWQSYLHLSVEEQEEIESKHLER